MAVEKVFFSLGSNLGDRNSHILEALSRMDDAFGVHWSALSSIIETPSWGFQGQDFLNCAVLYEIDSDPFSVLSQIKAIEREMGRSGEPEYAPDGGRIYKDRPIDIDIIFYGERTVDTPDLKIPHPLAAERDFVMRPLSEIRSPEP